MIARTFLDTNVLVYAFDVGEPRKRDVALRLLDEAEAGGLVVSTQVLSEFYVTVTRKLERPLSSEDAGRAVAELARLDVVAITAPLVLAGIRRSGGSVLSLWDSLIVEAARHAGCGVLLTEDLTHGQRFGDVVVEDPFRGVAN
jgi:predicted nucleic acid-binding protein